MCTHSSDSLPNDSASSHSEFLLLYPIVERHAKIVFRDHSPSEREEAIAEAVAASFESYVALRARGKDPARDFPTSMASFAVHHVKNGRKVGGKTSSKDVLSRKAQRRHGFRVESLPLTHRVPHGRVRGSLQRNHDLDGYEEQLRDDTRTPVADQVAFRIDWPEFLQTLTDRDRRMAHALSEDRPAKEVARRFGMSPGRVTQLRQRWHRDWEHFQGEPVEEQEIAMACG